MYVYYITAVMTDNILVRWSHYMIVRRDIHTERLELAKDINITIIAQQYSDAMIIRVDLGKLPPANLCYLDEKCYLSANKHD